MHWTDIVRRFFNVNFLPPWFNDALGNSYCYVLCYFKAQMADPPAWCRRRQPLEPRCVFCTASSDPLSLRAPPADCPGSCTAGLTRRPPGRITAPPGRRRPPPGRPTPPAPAPPASGAGRDRTGSGTGQSADLPPPPRPAKPSRWPQRRANCGGRNL